MEKGFLLAIDQSTSGTKALIVDRSGTIAARSALAHRQSYPKPGWVEHDPLEIYENVKAAARRALSDARVPPGQLVGMTIANQRETAVIWERSTGKPLSPAIVWQCQRTADACAALKAAGYEETVKMKTGLPLDPYFTATKWKWMLDHAEGARDKAASGELLAGTIDSWLLWKLSGGAVHATDFTNASRTSLFNIHTLRWDDELCRLFDVPIGLLPEVKFSDAVFGTTRDADLFPEPVPITGVIGDSQAALFGHLCLEPGMAKATYGTGTSVLMNIGDRPAAGLDGVVNAIAWGRDGKVTYAAEAVIRTSGDCIKWVRDNLGLFDTFEEMDGLLQKCRQNDGVYIVPAFVGLGAPYWAPDARASIIGLSRRSGRPEIVRAALESIAYQVRDALELLHNETGIPFVELRADGGASDNSALMQFQADQLGRPVIKAVVAELSALGSAYIGGLGLGFWSSPAAIAGLRKDYKAYKPSMNEMEKERLYQGWQRAVRSVLSESVAGRP